MKHGHRWDAQSDKNFSDTMATAMVVIGMTGGIAAGKSFVTRELGRLGAAVLDADRAGHAVLRLLEVKLTLYRRWGKAVFSERTVDDSPSSDRPAARSTAGEGSAGEHGSAEQTEGGDEWVRGRRVDRAAVADRVFAPQPDGPPELEFLESVTHPLIGALLARRLERLRRGGRFCAAVLDAPVLYKAGWEANCDTILFVDAPWEVRAARAARRGWSREQLRMRQAMQPSLEWQRERADVVIDNGAAAEETTEQIERFWQSLAPKLAK